MAEEAAKLYEYFCLLGGVTSAPKAKAASSGAEKQAKEKKVQVDSPAKQHKGKDKAAKAAQHAKGGAAASASSKSDKGTLGVTASKTEDLAEWYKQTLTSAELIDYYDISGCYIIRPWAYAIWEQIQAFFDSEIKKLGVRNAYFPLLVSERALTAEKDHIEGFAPEVAWVTKAGNSELAEPVAIRPTSETIMYPAYARWIRSHRDLPLQLNQWCSVVRWEFKHPVPFLRSREFLWQEGHSVFPDEESAGKEVLQILELYRRVYEELLAVPVVKGRKSEKEKFAGGYYTTTCEAFVGANGRGIQAATSHCLGQNFSKMFHIEFEDHAGHKQLAWQNSWGLTTRSVGVMIMVHGDDKGLVLPPRVAPIQVVLVPIFYKGKDNEGMRRRGKEIVEGLQATGVRAFLDDRDVYAPGWKFNNWEMRGVPIRLEFGPKDMESNQVVVARRDTGTKESVPLSALAARVAELLVDIQASLFRKAREERDAHVVPITTWSEFVPTLNAKNLVLVPWCSKPACEDEIKGKSQKEAKAMAEEGGFQLTAAAKSLCIPLEQRELKTGTRCFACADDAVCWALFGRSY